VKIPIEQIIPDPNQPRKTFDVEAIKELASSFESYGVISLLKVRPRGDNQYMIIAGEMRYRAAKLRGDGEVECVVQEATDQQTREMQFIENLQRSDIPPLEMGEAFYNHRKEYNLTQEQLRAIVGLSKDSIQHYESIYANLLPVNKNYVKSGRLDFTSAAAIASIEDPARQTELGDIAVGKELTRDTVKKISSMVKAEPDRPVEDIVDDVLSGKAKKEEMERLEAAKRTAGVILETPEELDKAAEALKKEAQRKARQAMTPEKRAQLEAEKRAKEQAKAEAKRLKDEEQKRKKAEEDQKREERAEKKVRKQLLENHSFLGEVLAKAPTELIEERIYTPEQREILKKPSRPTTQWDRFNELEKLADKLSNGLAELPQTPAFAKMTLGITLQSLRARIDETLQRMGMQVVEGEVKRIKEG